MPQLFDFENKSSCCGCSACFAVCPVNAINLKADNEGFLYPEVDSVKCLECNKCLSVCPLKKDRENVKLTNSFYAVKHREKDTISNSSSGGFFTAVTDKILENGGVIYGVIFDENFAAVHSKATDKDARDKMRVSKYLQSNLSDTFKKVKEDILSGIPVLFTGTPCQVEGLNQYLGKDYDNFYTMDVICHGTPSPLMFSEHIKHIEKVRRKKVVGYKCRSKVKGWHTHTEEAFFAKGKSEAGTPLLQEHKILFYSGHILRPSCYECKFTNLKRPSDISLGDFWGIEKVMPDLDDQLGTSMILINTKKGDELFNNVSDDITFRKSESYGRQPHLEKSAKKPSDRDIFWSLYKSKGYDYVAKKYGRNNTKEILKYHIKKILKR